ncbi:MAG TPA: redox-sensing transcriptional repressor Rex [Anaerolineales bacterium]|nr:redox-sensing transcriptional repressor Rex [Anaerolineales bacterium]
MSAHNHNLTEPGDTHIMALRDIPDIVVGRLPVYLRALSRMAQEGQTITSSKELGERLGISSAQIRKDLSHFGEFGKQGTGYQIEYLIEQVQRILKVNTEWEVALVGVGDLGRALAHYNGFVNRGFRISAPFDSDPAKIGTTIDELKIMDAAKMVEEIRARGLKVAMLAVPAEKAQAVADKLVEAGIRAILNYAPINISTPSGVRVQYIDPVIHLQRMTFYLDMK